ncbi:Ig-like domain-containing protein [Bacillus sp. FJAT-27264]|uniref:Ig-like domain-containing protein n=1 Tax=Paenibacillus sp. (strain DSM 101736 / FJAT-27264) TaxID=1850362 RepID=UPI00336A55C6
MVTQAHTLKIGDTLQVTYTSPHDARVTFTSSDIDIATVNFTGLVAGQTAGEVTISVTNATNGDIFDTVTFSIV